MNRNEINIHERRGRTDVSRFRIEKTDGRIHREIQPDEREVSEGTQEVNISGSQNGRLRRTYDRDSAESRGENGRTASGADENSRSDRRTESSRPDEVGRNSEQLQTAGRGDDQRGDYIQLSLFPKVRKNRLIMEQQQVIHLLLFLNFQTVILMNACVQVEIIKIL